MRVTVKMLESELFAERNLTLRWKQVYDSRDAQCNALVHQLARARRVNRYALLVAALSFVSALVVVLCA